MRTFTMAVVAANLLWVCGIAFGAPAAARARACDRCGRALGTEVPESVLSRDPEFKAHGMFQRCQCCLDSTMSRAEQERYVEVAKKYRENSIRHNREARPVGRNFRTVRNVAASGRERARSSAI